MRALKRCLFRNSIIVCLCQVSCVWVVKINSVQVSAILRKVRIDVVHSKAIHQHCALGFKESVPHHVVLLGGVAKTPFCATPQACTQINSCSQGQCPVGKLLKFWWMDFTPRKVSLQKKHNNIIYQQNTLNIPHTKKTSFEKSLLEVTSTHSFR